MNTLTFAKDKSKTKITFKVLTALLLLNVVWVIYEFINYGKYLNGKKFLINFSNLSEISTASNIMLFFSNFFGLLGMLTFALAIIKLLKKKKAVKALTFSFMFQLMSCTTLVINSIFTMFLPSYAQGSLAIQKYVFLTGNILLVATFIMLLMYMANLCKKKTAIVASIMMIAVNVFVVIDFFIVKFNESLEFFFGLFLAMKLMYLLISIITLITINYTKLEIEK